MAQAIDLGPIDEGIDLGPIDLGPVEEESIGSKLKKNFTGLAAGAYDLARGVLVDMPLQAGMSLGGIARGENASTALGAANLATEDAVKGIRAEDTPLRSGVDSPTYKYMMAPFQWLGEKIHQGSEYVGELTGNKDIGAGTEIAANIGSAVAPIPGTKLASKVLKKGMETLDPGIKNAKYTKPEPLPEQVIDLGPIEYPKKEKAPPNTIVKSQKRVGSESKDSKTQLYKQYAPEELSLAEDGAPTLQPQVPEPGLDLGINEGTQAPIARDMRGEQVYGVQGERTGPIEKTQDASSMFEQSREAIANREEDRVGRLEEQLTGKLSEQERAQRAQEEQAARDQQKLEWRIQQKIEADQLRRQQAQRKHDSIFEQRTRTQEESPLDYDLTLEDHPFREETRQADNNKIENTRGEFPTDDIKLLPERVQGDRVLQNLYTKLKDVKTRLENTQGDRATLQPKSPDYYPDNTISDQLKTVFGKTEEKLRRQEEILRNQIRTRLAREHGWKPEGREGPREEYDTRLYSGKDPIKTEPPNMQRSPDAKITNTAKVQKTTRHPLGGVGKKQGGSFDPTVFSEGISKLLGKGKTPKIPKYEPKGLTAKLASMGPTDPRDVNKFVEDVLPQASTFKDLNIGQRAISHAINPDNVANIVAKRTNPIISFVNSKLNDIDRMIRNEKQNATHGEAFKPGIRGWEKRVAGDDGAITLYEKAPKVSQEKIRKVAREWQEKGDQLEAMGLKYATDDMYRASGLSDAEIKALRAMENQTTKLFDRANAIIKKVNPEAKPIEHKAGYVPDIWEGDYRVFVRDKDGNAVHVGSAPTWYHAKFLEKKLKERFPDHDINTKTVEESKYALNDTSAFAMVHNLLGDTREGKIIAKYEAEVKAHRGYKRHGLHKKGAQGALGSAVGDTKGFAKAREMYLNSGYEFIGDMERQLLERDLQRAFKEKGYDLNNELPETRKYISTLVANSKGAIENHLKLIDHALEGVGKGVGLGPNAARNILGLLNSAASTAWLSSVKFIELNGLQPLVGAGKALEVQLALKGENAPGAFMKALLATYIPGLASAEQRAAMSFAKRNGHIDAKFVDAFGVGPMTHDWAKRAVDTLPKHLLGVVEQEMVRTPMFLTFNGILKDVIKDPKERWHAAGALTEYTMTNYSRTQALPIWQRAGFVGDAVKPMKAFAINATGQLMDLTHAAVAGKSAKTTVPLLVSLGVAWGLSGVQGSAPAQLADNMIDLINSVLSADNQLPNVEELLIGSGMKDEYIFGMISQYTGQNLSGSLAFPDIASMGSAPGLQYGKNILTEGGGYLLKDMQGKATEADKMKAALAVAPAQGREIVKEKFTRPGHGVPDPKNEMHSRLPPRDEGTSLKAMITAAEPESEHIQKAHIRAYENAKKREGSGRAVWKTKLINDFIHEGQLNQEALDMFVEKGGDPRNLSTSVKKWMVDDILSFYAQEMVKNKGISLVNAMERLEKFRVMLEGQEPKDLADDWQQSQ